MPRVAIALMALATSACLTPGDEPYAGWKELESSSGGSVSFRD